MCIRYSYNTIKDCIVDCENAKTTGYGILITGGDRNVICNNVIVNTPFNGIMLYPSVSNTIVDNNKLYDTAEKATQKYQLYIVGTTDKPCNDNIVANNIVKGDATGATLQYGNKVTLKGNVIVDNSDTSYSIYVAGIETVIFIDNDVNKAPTYSSNVTNRIVKNNVVNNAFVA